MPTDDHDSSIFVEREPQLQTTVLITAAPDELTFTWPETGNSVTLTYEELKALKGLIARHRIYK